MSVCLCSLAWQKKYLNLIFLTDKCSSNREKSIIILFFTKSLLNIQFVIITRLFDSHENKSPLFEKCCSLNSWDILSILLRIQIKEIELSKWYNRFLLCRFPVCMLRDLQWNDTCTEPCKSALLMICKLLIKGCIDQGPQSSNRVSSAASSAASSATAVSFEIWLLIIWCTNNCSSLLRVAHWMAEGNRDYDDIESEALCLTTVGVCRGVIVAI